MNKDIRFSDKKVDESWKEQAAKEKGINVGPKPQASSAPSSGSGNSVRTQETPSQKATPPTSKILLNFLTSLGLQAMMHLGEMPNPETGQPEINLDAAKELIDFLNELKIKTQGNLSDEESRFFNSFLPEVQLKYAAKV